MHRFIFFIAASLSLSVNLAQAGFEQWTIEKEDDPFVKGKSVTVGYMSSLRSGAYIFCDSSNLGSIRVRLIPGFEFTSALQGYSPDMDLAIDGDVILHAEDGSTGAVGQNLATAEFIINGEDARTFVDAIKRARRQIAIKDGISDRPHLLKARGSTAAGAALETCMNQPN